MADVVIEEFAEILVPQPLDGLDLDPESIQDLERPRAPLQRHLECDLPVEPVVPRPEDLAHAAAGDAAHHVARMVRSSSAGPNGAEGSNGRRQAGQMLRTPSRAPSTSI